MLHRVQTGPMVHPTHHPMRAGGFSAVVELPEHEPGGSTPYSAEVKNGGAKPPLPYGS
jgi:hypothetical protein